MSIQTFPCPFLGEQEIDVIASKNGIGYGLSKVNGRYITFHEKTGVIFQGTGDYPEHMIMHLYNGLKDMKIGGAFVGDLEPCDLVAFRDVVYEPFQWFTDYLSESKPWRVIVDFDKEYKPRFEEALGCSV